MSLCNRKTQPNSRKGTRERVRTMTRKRERSEYRGDFHRLRAVRPRERKKNQGSRARDPELPIRIIYRPFLDSLAGCQGQREGEREQ